MADYCQQCSLRIFGRDMRDMAGLCRPGDSVWELCEGCGDIVEIDHDGRRLSSNPHSPEDGLS